MTPPASPVLHFQRSASLNLPRSTGSAFEALLRLNPARTVSLPTSLPLSPPSSPVTPQKAPRATAREVVEKARDALRARNTAVVKKESGRKWEGALKVWIEREVISKKGELDRLTEALARTRVI